MPCASIWHSFRLPRLLIGNGFPGIFFVFALFRLRFFFCFFCFNLFHFRFFIFVHVLREDGRSGEQKQDQGKERKLGMTECQIKLIPKAFCNIGKMCFHCGKTKKGGY